MHHPLAHTIRSVSEDESTDALRRIHIGGSPIANTQVRYFQKKLAKYKVYKLMWSDSDERQPFKNVVVLLPQSGRTGLFFTSQPTGPRGAQTIARVIKHACENTPPNLVNLAQALIGPQDDLQLAIYRHAGFEHLADLDYMRADLPDEAPAPVCPPGVELVPYAAALRPAFKHVLNLSYEQTLDCPGLKGLRRTEDVLKGHMAAGEFDPHLWTLLTVDEQPAGVLLLNPIGAIDSIELVYLGLSLEHRGKRLANLLMEHTLHQCAARPESQITLAMDDRNKPAQALYQRFGFKNFDKRVALIRPLKNDFKHE
ncbi:MAG: GNAT family N-acetyltransferase [Planctomycetota bacterium]|jgi:ribosomal protein S18 acetylase RimI-like enzyme